MLDRGYDASMSCINFFVTADDAKAADHTCEGKGYWNGDTSPTNESTVTINHRVLV